MHRFFVSKQNLCGENVVLAGQQVHQIRNVLRMSPGEHIIVLDNQGWEYEAVLESLSSGGITAQVIEKRKATGESAVQITLYQSLLRYDRFEWVLQKCTEVGAGRFVPLITQRSVIRNPNTISSKKQARWQSIIAEASEQSGRGRIPELSPPIKLEDGIAGLAGFDCRLIASLGTQGVDIHKAFHRADKPAPTSIALFVGPEGGFTEQELQRCRANGAIDISLGRRVLRTETAAVVAVALILYELGEMQP